MSYHKPPKHAKLLAEMMAGAILSQEKAAYVKAAMTKAEEQHYKMQRAQVDWLPRFHAEVECRRN